MQNSRSLVAAALLLALAAVPAAAQTAPATPGATETQEAQDSGVGREDVENWIGKTVIGAGGQTLGTVTSVARSSDTSDAGTLTIARENGGEATLPLLGASASGDTVTVSATAESVESPPAASVN